MRGFSPFFMKLSRQVAKIEHTKLMNMTIGIEAQRLFRLKKHGMDMVVLELIKELQKIDHENQYYIYVAPGEDHCIEETSNFKIRIIGGNFYPLWEQKTLPKAAKRDHCDILHCTSNTAPLTTSIPLVVTLHDIIFMEKSPLSILTGNGSNYQKMGNLYRRWNVPKVVKKCSKLITVSKSEKVRLCEYFNLGHDKVEAVYNGVSTHFIPVTDQIKLNEFRARYSLPDRFFLHLGNTDPKKNTAGVLKALSDYKKRTGDNVDLVMLDFDKEELSRIINEIGDETLLKSIYLTGYVKNQELPALYSLAEQFLYPSLRESFGIPILEAMACGVPVITGNTSSMPEISGDAALLVDPFNSDEIVDAIIKIKEDNTLRAEMIEKGFKQAEKFSWKAMAHQVYEIYRHFEKG